MIWTLKAFLTFGLTICGSAKFERKSENADNKFFKRSFGVSPDVCSQTWELLTFHHLVPQLARPMHVLWALLFFESIWQRDFSFTNFKNVRKDVSEMVLGHCEEH